MNIGKVNRALDSMTQEVAGRHFRWLAILWIGFIIPVQAQSPTPTPTAVPPGWNVEKVGQSGGACLAAVIEGDYIYRGEGVKLIILDISNPSSPAVRSQIELPGIILDIVVSEGLAYVVDGYGSLQIVDASNPTTPTLRGCFTIPRAARSVAISGGLAYVADEEGGVYILRYTGIIPPTPIPSPTPSPTGLPVHSRGWVF